MRGHDYFKPETLEFGVTSVLLNNASLEKIGLAVNCALGSRVKMDIEDVLGFPIPWNGANNVCRLTHKCPILDFLFEIHSCDTTAWRWSCCNRRTPNNHYADRTLSITRAASPSSPLWSTLRWKIVRVVTILVDIRTWPHCRQNHCRRSAQNIGRSYIGGLRCSGKVYFNLSLLCSTSSVICSLKGYFAGSRTSNLTIQSCTTAWL